MRSPLLLVHIIAGTLGMLSGFVTVFLRKGSRRHGLAGNVFVISMLSQLTKQTAAPPAVADYTALTNDEAKLTGRGVLVGTFQYMAPEQLEGKEANACTDIFGLGEVIHEMATGKPAFSGGSRRVSLQQF